MSLINNMLAGLEDRQAYMSEGKDLVLDGLTPVNDDNFHHIKQRRFIGSLFVILLLSSGIFLSSYIYKIYPGNNLHNDTTVDAGSIVEETQPAHPDNDLTRVQKNQLAAAETDSPPREQVAAVNSVALKMDYGISAAGITTKPPAEQAVETAVNKTVEQGVVPAADPAITAFNIGRIDGRDVAVNLELNEMSDFHVYELKNPYRVAVEFEKFLSLPEEIPRSFDNGLISKIRGHHIYHNKRTMIVFDLTGRAVVKDSDMKETGAGYELAVHISPVSTGNESRSEENTPDTAAPAASVENQVTKPAKGKLSVKKNNVSPDQLLARGLSDYQKGKIQAGLEKISQVLEVEPKHVQARSTLVNLLIEQNDIPLAINVLDGGINLYPEKYNWRELRAKLLVKLNKNDEAIETLSKSGPNPVSDPEYYAFLAALLQQQGRNDEAVGYYQKVVAARGDNGIWWMGLGISLERTGKTDQAEDAYRKAVRDSSLAPDIRDFIKNRISFISGQ